MEEFTCSSEMKQLRYEVVKFTLSKLKLLRNVSKIC